MAAAERITFPGSTGATLAARLDRPGNGRPRAFALFAHCFSCSKDIFAAARISQALGDHGIAVLRFDSTGLGHSDGDFANTNFSSNVEDLLAAVDYMRAHQEAPALLIGHSLGGAAVLMAAAQVPEARAVVTLAAPADTEHVVNNFIEHLPEIEARGEAQVQLGGRPFTIKQQFVEDLQGQKVVEAAKELKRAYLVMHAPLDQTVGIDNATRLFVAARHPKSFVSLDNADHLITRRADAHYAAEVIAAWASRYLTEGEDAQGTPGLANPPASTVTVRETDDRSYAAEMAAGRHRLFGDQPMPIGQDLGPNPYDYLSLSLALCTTQTVRMYAGRKKLDLAPVTVSVHSEKVYTEDCEGCVDGKGMKVLHLTRTLILPPDVPQDVAARLLEIADRCPVHQTLAHHHAVITTSLGS